LRGCYEQLKASPIQFKDVDYGYAWENSFLIAWADWSDGVRAGVVIGIIVGGIVVLSVLCCCMFVFGW